MVRPVLVLLLTVLAAFAELASSYKGNWTSDESGNGGTIRVALKPEPGLVFTVSGREVKATVASSKIEADTIEIAYDFELQGYKLRSTIRGTVKDGKLDAKYRTESLADGSAVDAGTVKATAEGKSSSISLLGP